MNNAQTEQMVAIEEKVIELRQLLNTLERSYAFEAERDYAGTLSLNLSSLQNQITKTIERLVYVYQLSL